MISCSKCGRKLRKPIRKLENSLFSIEVYKCKKCNLTYKEANYQRIIC
jgi:ribosomal protein L37AE/L43A